MLVEHVGTALAVEECQAVKNPMQISPWDGLISVSQKTKKPSFVNEGRATTLALNTLQPSPSNYFFWAVHSHGKVRPPPNSSIIIRLIPLWPQGGGISASQLNNICQAKTSQNKKSDWYTCTGHSVTTSRKGQKVASADNSFQEGMSSNGSNLHERYFSTPWEEQTT